MNDDEANLYEAGTKIGMDKADEDYTVKLKAEYGEPPADVKYAVSIYGIKQDEVQEPEKVAALTFGPATGGNYTGNGEATEPSGLFYRACDGTSETSPKRSSDGHPCMHWMSWSEIIAQANADPTVFEPCLKNGCTHSVELRLSKSLKSGSHIEMTGDGAGVLSSSIETSYKQWNSSDNVTGGWPASRIRTTLNGSENCEPDTTNVAGSSLLSEADALISAFPSELQAAIIPKAVKSDTVYYDKNEGNEITYDKLWLFSIKEITAGRDNLARPNEGTAFGEHYQRAEELGTDRSTYCCNENGSTVVSLGGTWSRSLWNASNMYACVFAVGSSGELVSMSLGISPGFCIGMADAPKNPQAVLYNDGTMIFYEDAPDPNDEVLHSGIVNTYTDWSNQHYVLMNLPPWYLDIEKILTVNIKGHITPKFTSYWFYDAINKLIIWTPAV